ncbi:hypothetical protein ABT294_39680 [Nonomuraea sp. NPDC000554]|uniref:hypothetical protein n=1 Tax=Nonomuraea sp. NPDC000554 TaxID=3154259 RepID=UPI0033201112
MKAIDHPLVQELLSLRLPPDHFVIAGSGPLLAHGIKDDIGDLDVVARDEAWSTALSLGTPTSSPFGAHVQRVVLLDGKIEIFNGWFPESGTVDELMDRSDAIDGLRYESLDDIRRWKRRLDRPKDRADIALIERHVSRLR